MRKSQIYQTIKSNGNINHDGNNDQNWEIRNTSVDHTKHGKYNINIIRKPHQKIYGQRIYQDR